MQTRKQVTASGAPDFKCVSIAFAVCIFGFCVAYFVFNPYSGGSTYEGKNGVSSKWPPFVILLVVGSCGGLVGCAAMAGRVAVESSEDSASSDSAELLPWTPGGTPGGIGV